MIVVHVVSTAAVSSCQRLKVVDVVSVTLQVAYSSSHDSSNITDSDIHQPYVHHVLLPSFDPWMLCLDQYHSAPVAVAMNSSTKANVTRSPSHVKSAIDKFISDVSHKASLRTVNGELESEMSDRISKSSRVKPLYLLAAECKERRGTEQITDLKMRLTEMLGKLNQRAAAAAACELASCRCRLLVCPV